MGNKNIVKNTTLFLMSNLEYNVDCTVETGVSIRTGTCRSNFKICVYDTYTVGVLYLGLLFILFLEYEVSLIQ